MSTAQKRLLDPAEVGLLARAARTLANAFGEQAEQLRAAGEVPVLIALAEGEK